jgi:hypothetical protein
VFDLLWHQHGGSGLSLSYQDLLELDLNEVLWFRERQSRQRQREAAEIRKAGRRRAP